MVWCISFKSGIFSALCAELDFENARNSVCQFCDFLDICYSLSDFFLLLKCRKIFFLHELGFFSPEYLNS